MSDRIYSWQRFWCPRSGRINLADGGYLCDPEAEWGNVYNPDLVTFEAISKLPCLVLLGEPGMGKTHAMTAEQAIITPKIQEQGGQVLLRDLRSYSSPEWLARKLFESAEFTNWLRGTHQLHIFLDSLDECLLRIETLATLLVDEFKEYRDQIHRLHLRIACRTAIWPSVLEDGLKQLWGKDAVGVYELAPLRRKDVTEAARAEAIELDEFLEEVQKKNIVSLAIKPVTLKFLLNTYHRHNNQFPANQRLHELYLEGCRCLCEESNESRLASRLKGKLNLEQRLIVAARIATVTIFANRFAVWTGREQDEVPDEDVLLRKICQGSESVSDREIEVTETVVEEVLDTGLFSSRGLNRMGWAHQTYAEFLAAWYLVQHEVPVTQVMGLIVSSEDSERKLVPQLHETAAWLASMRTDVLQEIIKTDPDVLLRSDLPTDATLQEAIVDNLLKQYEQEKLSDWNKDNYQRYVKLKHSRLAAQLQPYIQDSSKPIDARDAAIDIAEVCEVCELQEELVDLALDSSQSIHLRVSAAKAVCSIGDADAKLKLKPLAVGQLLEDEDDRLKGYCLSAVWSDHLTARELFKAITPPKKRIFLGKYQIFIEHELAPKLQSNDLRLALNWVENQGSRCFGHPFERLADAILIKAWERFDIPGIAEDFTKVALIQWREYQRVITHNNNLEQKFQSSLINDKDKRYQLIEQAVLIVSKLEENPSFLLSSATETLLMQGDVSWMLEKLQDTECQASRKIWAQLIQWSFNRNDAKEIDAIVTATQTNDILREELASYFEAIELKSAKAEKMKADYLRIQEWQNRSHDFPLLEPPPRERVLQLIAQVESGNLSAWWQLNMEMTLKPDSQYYGDELESDLTELPGWQEADEVTRKRIIDSAKKYIQEQSEVTYDWIGTNNYNRPTLAGCRAFQLILKESPDYLKSISPCLWKKWVPIIVAFPKLNSIQQEHDYLELVRIAYQNAQNEAISALNKLLYKAIQNEHISPNIFEKIEKCWDDNFKHLLLEKLRQISFNSKLFKELLEELLKLKVNEARDFAELLIHYPLPSVEEERQRTVVATSLLVEYGNPSSWSVVWASIQQEPEFGREVIEAVADRYPHGIHLKLTEKQLADLYIWLVHQYPHNEDPDYSNDVLAHCVGTRESVANFRDCILEQLRNMGTPQACAEIQRIAQEFPKLTWLRKILLDAKITMRRKTWQPPKPDEIFQIVSNKQMQMMKTVLLLAANPKNSSQLRLSEEVREIDEGLTKRSRYREQFKLESKLAVRQRDFYRHMLDIQPQIVHFSGHGAGEDGIVLEDETGNATFVQADMLASMFKLFASKGVECVLFNACYSEVQAEAVSKYIPYVIGMNKPIGDKAAIDFAVAFYDALGAGETMEFAFELGCSQLVGLKEHETPVFFVRGVRT